MSTRMTPDEIKALVAEARSLTPAGRTSLTSHERMMHRLADALEAALPFLRPEPSESKADHDHRPVQHRDGREPWCKVCGLNPAYEEPPSNPGDIVHAVFRAIGPAFEAALSARPAEETDSRAAAWQEGWERGFRDMQAAERDEDGYVVVKPTRNPYLPVSTDGNEN